MSKPNNRNAERIANGKKPKVNVSGRNSNKPFIGNNVFTMENQAIAERIIRENPDWTVLEIKDALPYAHTTKTIINLLRRMLPQTVIDQHMAPTDTRETDDAQTDVPYEAVRDGAALDDAIAELWPVFGPEYPAWPELIGERVGIDVSERQIRRRARALGLGPADFTGGDWSDTEDELLRECGAALVGDGNPDSHVYDLFDVPRAKYWVCRRIRDLNERYEHERAASDATEKPSRDAVKDTAPAQRKENDNMPNDSQKPDYTDNRQAFADLSAILMSLPQSVAIHVDIKFPDGMSIRFDRDAVDGR